MCKNCNKFGHAHWTCKVSNNIYRSTQSYKNNFDSKDNDGFIVAKKSYRPKKNKNKYNKPIVENNSKNIFDILGDNPQETKKSMNKEEDNILKVNELVQGNNIGKKEELIRRLKSHRKKQQKTQAQMDRLALEFGPL